MLIQSPSTEEGAKNQEMMIQDSLVDEPGLNQDQIIPPKFGQTLMTNSNDNDFEGDHLQFTGSFRREHDSHSSWKEKVYQLKHSRQVADANMLLTPLKKMITNRYFPKHLNHVKKKPSVLSS